MSLEKEGSGRRHRVFNNPFYFATSSPHIYLVKNCSQTNFWICKKKNYDEKIAFWAMHLILDNQCEKTSELKKELFIVDELLLVHFSRITDANFLIFMILLLVNENLSARNYKY